MNGHVADLAGLYAAGSLDERNRNRVDAHVSECEACAAELGAAEEAVRILIAERQPEPALDAKMRHAFAGRRSRGITSALIAAAFLAGLLPSIWLWSIARDSAAFTADREQAVHAMAGSHFAHLQFAPLAADAPKAKVIYARSGRWRLVIVDAGRGYTVAAQSDAGIVRLGQLHVQGGAAELFLPDAPRVRTLLLLDGARPVARATLPYRQ